jgi:mannose-6-phosphate isomerase
MQLHPIKFAPILKEMIWGGKELKNTFNKISTANNIGESWELSALPGNISIACNGTYKGMTLNEIIALSPTQILGKRITKRYGNNFPLLVKFIDAADNLSIQVHPNDEQAKSNNSHGKTEMWYILKAKPDATLISGLNKTISPQEFQQHVSNGTLTQALQSHKVSAGDAFFIPAGRIHAIGSGIVLLEIQQSSDITYRIFDYNRRDSSGNQRQLHTQQAMQVINFNDCLNTKTTIPPTKNTAIQIANCPYFNVNVMRIEWQHKMERNYTANESFTILVCTQGNGMITYNAADSMPICAGETLLLPAALTCITLTPTTDGMEIVEAIG